MDLGGGSQGLYFNTANNRISGWSYDAAGNLLNDGAHSYTYDAEGKISKVDSVTAYTYDGEGQRVKKLVGENTRFIYGIDGELIAEFDGSTGNLKKEYVYGGAALVTIEPTAVNANGTQYTTSDNLRSPRVHHEIGWARCQPSRLYALWRRTGCGSWRPHNRNGVHRQWR